MRSVLPALVVCAALAPLACSGDEFTPSDSPGGAAGTTAGGSSDGGAAGSSAGGASAGAAGTNGGTGGSAGSLGGGAAGSTAGGAAGSTAGGTAGSTAGGAAGSTAGGAAGSTAGGAAGSTAGGAAGSTAGGAAGSPGGGAAGSPGGGAAGEAGSGGTAGSGPCTVLYVKPDGDDSSSGCSPEEAKHSIGNAALKANTPTSIVTEIRVCQGIYTEPALSLDVAVDVRGGYDCTSFDRPNDLTDKIRSVVLPKADTKDRATVRIGPKLRSFDGFRVVGSPPEPAPIAGRPDRHLTGVALLVEGTATTKLLRNTLVGGSFDGSANGKPGPTAGVEVGGQASPVFEDCQINGGGGTTDGTDEDQVGSIGLVARPGLGRPTFVSTTIDGGTGAAKAPSGSLGSMGMLLYERTFTGNGKLTGLTVNGGAGKAPKGSGSLALFATGGAIEIEGGVWNGGTGGPSGAEAVSTIGLAAGNVSSFIVRRARVYGGDVMDKSTDGLDASVAMQVHGASSVVVETSILHGGGAKTAPGANRASTGLVLAGVDDARVSFTTFVTGATLSNSLGVRIQGFGQTNNAGADIIRETGAVTLEGSLFLGRNGDNVYHASSLFLPVLRGNAFFSEDNRIGCTKCESAVPKQLVLPTEVLSTFPGSQDNVVIRAINDATEAKSLVKLCATFEECGKTLFEQFDVDKTGLVALEDISVGFRLKQNLPCGLAKLYTPDPPLPSGTKDLFAMPRSAPASPGVSEQESCLE